MALKEVGPMEPIKTHMQIPRGELIAPGHSACQGCGHFIIVRHLLKASGPNTIVVNPTGCLEVVTTVFPYTSWKVPWIHVAFENGGAVASGVEAAIKSLQRKGILPKDEQINVVVFAGDGGTVDIGFQSLSGLLERGHKVVYVLLDNEAYMNTGIQRSGSTPFGAWTTTTPVGKKWKGEWRVRKDMIQIAVAHHIPYAATINPAYPVDMYNKMVKALKAEGPAFLHAYSPCPTGWRFDPSLTIEVARMAVLTGYWILYEYDHGNYRVTQPVLKRKPVREFIKMQGRFRHMTEEQIKKLQEIIDQQVAFINKLVGKEVIGPVVEESK
jgi:pyruvate ferredoxin oxidoreductase beta subunit